jgi:metal-responsive CopG/Arc/MetJ family transcriptional regulator
VARRVEKVAVSVDKDLLRAAERLRRETGESRSAIVSRGLRVLLESAERERRVRDYIAAYERCPETSAEVAAQRRLAARTLASVPWEDDEAR